MLQWWATTLQFVGALVAAGGLAWAYWRASRFAETKLPRIRDSIRKILYALGLKRPVITGTMGATLHPVTASLGLETFAPMVRVRKATVEERIKTLEEFVDRLLNQDLPPVLRDIRNLKAELSEVRNLAKVEAEAALTTARAEMAKLELAQDREQTLDLRWAILGLFISAIGTFLQYFAAS
jgi:hypothetical protein